MNLLRLTMFGLLACGLIGCARSAKSSASSEELSRVIRREIDAMPLLAEAPPPPPMMAAVGKATGFETRIVVVQLSDRSDRVADDLAAALNGRPNDWTHADLQLFADAGYLDIYASPVLRSLPSEEATIVLQRAVPERNEAYGFRVDLTASESPEGAIELRNINIRRDLGATSLTKQIPSVAVARGESALVAIDTEAAAPRHFVLLASTPTAGG